MYIPYTFWFTLGYGNCTRLVFCPVQEHPESAILIITCRNTIAPKYKRQNLCKSPTKSSDITNLPSLWRHESLHVTAGVVLRTPSQWARKYEECRQAHKPVWPVGVGIVIWRNQNHWCQIPSNHKHIWGCSNMTIMNLIDTGVKVATDTRSPSWPRRLFDAAKCKFTHPGVRDKHYNFAL